MRKIKQNGVESRELYLDILWYDFECNFPLKYDDSGGFNCNGDSDECLEDWRFCSLTIQHLVTEEIRDCLLGGVAILAVAGSIGSNTGTPHGAIAGFTIGFFAGTITSAFCIDNQVNFYNAVLCPQCQDELEDCCE